MKHKITKLLFTIIVLIIGINNIYAEDTTYTIVKRRFDNVYAVYDGTDRVHLFYGQTYIINNNQAFCIEPGVDINTTTYYGTTDLSLSGLNSETINKLKYLVYYGFKYPGHNNNNYYIATQELIWRLITNRDTYWVSEEDINGPRIDISREKNEITSLIETHNTKPSFDGEEIVVEVGKKNTITDTNGVLTRYKIASSNISNAKIFGNSLIITPTSLNDTGEIVLETNIYNTEEPMLFYNGNNQKLLSVNATIPKTKSTVKIKTIARPNIRVTKVDAQTGEAIAVAGLKFKIKNLDVNGYYCENTECVYVTNEEGYFTTTNKPLYANYQIEELNQPLDGYLWNKEPLKFTIDDTANLTEENGEYYLDLKFKNTRVTGEIIINKVGEKPIFNDNLITYESIPLNDVVFSLYAKDDIKDITGNIIYRKNEFINNYKTINGTIKITNLPLGNYYLKEVSTDTNHLIDNEVYEVSLSYKDSETAVISKTITIKNYLKKGILEFTKTDFLNGSPIENVEIAIYKDNDELIYTGYTNSLGKIILEGLPLGSYYIKEISTIDDYQLSDEPIYFEIKENNAIVNANMQNMKISVPSTNKNIFPIHLLLSFNLIILGGYLFGKAYK